MAVKTPDSFTFTVGKLDAGMAILLGERAHLIEFPSILLPPGATAGSIVNIAVHRNHAEEKRRDEEFWGLQKVILEEFGMHSPEPPDLQVRNVTQTSVTLEWPPIKLATARLRSLDIFRNGQRLAAIPSALTNTSTKLSGLELDSEYTFQLVLRTTAGTYPSNIVNVHTHTMTDTSGISVCFGTVENPELFEASKAALQEMGARWSDKIQIDTTHFVCTTPATTPAGAQASGSSVPTNAPGIEYQRALQLSIPVVQPQWILACHANKRMIPIGKFYLGADPPPISGPYSRPQSMSQASVKTPISPHASRASMPAPARTPETASPFVNQGPQSPIQRSPPHPIAEEESTDATAGEPHNRSLSSESAHKRNGTMNREFKFPTPVSSPVVAQGPVSMGLGAEAAAAEEAKRERSESPSTLGSSVSRIEVPPPPPVEKETSGATEAEADGNDDVGATVEIPL
ncbi:uncharacterized protein SCHCODRAFT_02620833 [Schizophyllum commune H4-8]|nr:uncharacterized protein SCHCODRAFT_02620833 [Schizophyllum commune H4-8]KAI5893094.1 hypothetical protein SCHCODRAFT_02620833 [Schizophyllum commune H4-8]